MKFHAVQSEYTLLFGFLCIHYCSMIFWFLRIQNCFVYCLIILAHLMNKLFCSWCSIPLYGNQCLCDLDGHNSKHTTRDKLARTIYVYIYIYMHIYIYIYTQAPCKAPMYVFRAPCKAPKIIKNDGFLHIPGLARPRTK